MSKCTWAGLQSRGSGSVDVEALELSGLKRASEEGRVAVWTGEACLVSSAEGGRVRLASRSASVHVQVRVRQGTGYSSLLASFRFCCLLFLDFDYYYFPRTGFEHCVNPRPVDCSTLSYLRA